MRVVESKEESSVMPTPSINVIENRRASSRKQAKFKFNAGDNSRYPSSGDDDSQEAGEDDTSDEEDSRKTSSYRDSSPEREETYQAPPAERTYVVETDQRAAQRPIFWRVVWHNSGTNNSFVSDNPINLRKSHRTIKSLQEAEISTGRPSVILNDKNLSTYDNKDVIVLSDSEDEMNPEVKLEVDETSGPELENKAICHKTQPYGAMQNVSKCPFQAHLVSEHEQDAHQGNPLINTFPINQNLRVHTRASSHVDETSMDLNGSELLNSVVVVFKDDDDVVQPRKFATMRLPVGQQI